MIRAKYILDRIFAVLLLILLSPTMIVISLLIKLHDGQTVFFRQKRPGLHGKEFTIWKFRTMVPDADRLLDKKGRVQDANRITPIGKFLRTWGIDEIPQVFNIINGEMSFVGPRPGLCEQVKRFSKSDKKRFEMKPGITGLSQIKGRHTLKWSQRIEYDIQYIENYSLWIDLKIIFKTFAVVLKRKNVILDRSPELYDDI